MVNSQYEYEFISILGENKKRKKREKKGEWLEGKTHKRNGGANFENLVHCCWNSLTFVNQPSSLSPYWHQIEGKNKSFNATLYIMFLLTHLIQSCFHDKDLNLIRNNILMKCLNEIKFLFYPFLVFGLMDWIDFIDLDLLLYRLVGRLKKYPSFSFFSFSSLLELRGFRGLEGKEAEKQIQQESRKL